jgi:TonB family protein
VGGSAEANLNSAPAQLWHAADGDSIRHIVFHGNFLGKDFAPESRRPIPVFFGTLLLRKCGNATYGIKRWRSYRMSRVLLVIVFLSVAINGNSQTSDATQAKHYALYAPRPEYPRAARKRHWTGAGVFACYIRSDGTVASVDVLRSTGHQMLDQAAITAFWAVEIPARRQIETC